ncbi:DNA methyltransferase [Streptococcus entericus]|uniref:DNA methyltransferase n=1 Tax=Streptococcus entericus TaxID=155680 RepID=UPI0003613DF4|nr:DNA methyltransferase [Streptococcus entericus]
MARLDIISIEDGLRDLVAQPDEGSFLYDFLGFYDIPKSTVTKLRKEGGTSIKNKLHYEQVALGSSCANRVHQIEQELAGVKSKPRYIMVTDFDQLAAKDVKTGDTLAIPFGELPSYADFFLAWNGIEKVDYARENPADIKAAERFTRLYDELWQINQFDDQTTEEKEFNLFLIRLLFLLFAEDTGIMDKNILTNAIKTRTQEDGSDLTDFFNQVFASLDRFDRTREADWLSAFPYVNGKLFTDAGTALQFDRKTRKLIIEAGELLNWDEINPDILGAMIQTVANKELRASAGMHYTSVPNIMKVIKPLFLDSLRATYEGIVEAINANEDKSIQEQTRRANRRAYEQELEALLTRLSKIRFFDPACGSGNFLIITYKEMRRLEIDLLRTLRDLRGDYSISLFERSAISLNQFYGIELDDFAHEVARLSLWIAEHQMNVEMKNHLNFQPALLPLKDAGNITQGNALRLDWNEVLPHSPNDEIYLIGNPPYIGAKLQSKEQKTDLELAIGKAGNYKKMDYIAGWFYKGADFITTANSKLAFVSTNSICQGEQVAIIWQELLNRVVIDFAYTSFKWGNSAAHNAGVTVAIISLATKQNASPVRYLFDDQLTQLGVDHISPYLTAGDDTIVASSSQVLNGLPKMVFGNMPNDGGGLIFSPQEYQEALSSYPELKPYLKIFIGAEEFIKGKKRYAFWLKEQEYLKVQNNPLVTTRIEKTRQHRLKSKRPATNDLAKMPWKFFGTNEPTEIQIIVPRVSSENRQYVPMGIVGEDTIISDSAMAIYSAPLWLLGLLMSRLHMVWLRAIGGKLKTDYRYSAGLVYNTFPVPELSTRRKNQLEEQVMEILGLREELGGTLAELYNREVMPASLREEHRKLDELIERAYKETPFANDEERLSHLLNRYKEMVKD